MPEPILPYEEMLQTELDYVGSPRQAKDRAFWQAELEGFGGPPAYSNIDGTHARDRYRKLIRKPDHPFGSVIFLSTAAKHEVSVSQSGSGGLPVVVVAPDELVDGDQARDPSEAGDEG